MGASNLLFTPIKVGNVSLKHRVVYAPLTRYRSTKKEHVPLDICATYYGQRATTPGTLMFTEATFIAEKAGGYDSAPGIWSDAQIKSWKKVTSEVHKHGSFIFLQLWALGRTAMPDILKEDGHPYVSSSPSPLADKGGAVPRELTTDEIKDYVGLYAQAAENAVMKAGFDGVEVHAANGYLIDQFLQDVCNKRTDSYGGSIENRSRFALEVVQAVIDRVGANRTGIRLSPFSTAMGMKMDDPIPQFRYFISQLAARHPDMAYIHVIEPRVSGDQHIPESAEENLDFAREAWKKTGKPFLAAGGFDRDKAFEMMSMEGMDTTLIAFGRWFLANPDLPKRLEKNLPLNQYNQDTFYKPMSPEGYIDYPFYDETVR